MDKIETLYAINEQDSGIVLTKLDKEKFITAREQWDWIPNIILNPVININGAGVLTISGFKHKYVKMRTLKNYHWVDTPVSEFKKDLSQIIFYSPDKHIINKDIINIFGFFFKKKIVTKDVPHLIAGHYLSKKGVKVEITSSNFTINE